MKWMVPVLLVVSIAPLAGQSGAKNGEWTTYGADLGNTRYSPLDQINADNFSKLEIAWRFKTESLGPRPEYQFESTPLMVKGVVYSTAGTRRAVVALDAATGELMWMHSEREGERAEAAPRQLSGRGLSYWTDGKDERILYVTPGYRLVALDARTGIPVQSSARAASSTSSRTTIRRSISSPARSDSIRRRSSPATRSSSARRTCRAACRAARATSRATSAGSTSGTASGCGSSTRFRARASSATTPGSVIRGRTPATPARGRRCRSTRSWGWLTCRSKRRPATTSAAIGTANNLFSESIVAVDLKTGQRKWHYQTVHHGIWDHDIPCAPILADITVNGKTIKALAQPTKQAFLFVLDRVTGKPIWPIEERPVEKGDVPSEWYAPTQPFPLDARGRVFQYDLNGFSKDDLIDFTPELRAEAEKIVSRYKIGPIYTPPTVSRAEGPLGTLQLAINGGGTVWAGGSFDPETRILYVYSRRSPGRPRTDQARSLRRTT